MIKRTLLLCFWMVVGGCLLIGQPLVWHPLASPHYKYNSSGDLSFKMESSFFFINNEFFGDIVEGYTLPGIVAEPAVIYHVGDNFRFRAGASFQQLYGDNEKLKVKPILSAAIGLFQNFQLTMGAIEGNLHHSLPDALFHYERSLTQPVENGFQLMYNSSQLQGRAWMNWEQFIRKGDTIPEIFTSGVVLRKPLLSPDSKWSLDIPFNALVMHRGGQISDFDEEGTSLLNLSTGVDLKRRYDGYVKSVGLYGHYFLYKDLKDANPLGLNKGNALYTGMIMESEQSKLMLGYWRADNFLSSRGNPIYHSVSDYLPGRVFGEREMINGSLLWYKDVHEGVVFSFLFEGFYDIAGGNLDYSYSFRIAFSPEFLITRL